jgi:hypothetical protein
VAAALNLFPEVQGSAIFPIRMQGNKLRGSIKYNTYCYINHIFEK